MSMRSALALLVMLNLSAAGSAQGGAPPSRPAPQAAPASVAAPRVPLASEDYTYDPAGRRDPFMDLLGVGTETRPVSQKNADGPAGLAVAEIAVRGIVQGRDALVAMVQAPDKKTYLIHQGDKFLDGVVKAITTQGLVIVQDVHDPLSPVKQREIRKSLRSVEDAKP